MKSFLQIAALVFGVAGGIYGYEWVTGDPVLPAMAPHQAVVPEGQAAVPVSRSKAPRVRTPRTIDIFEPQPERTDQLERMVARAGGSDFPILIPDYMTRDAAMVEDYNVRLKLLEGGYSAVVTTAEMDIVIYGTKTVFRRKDEYERELKAVDESLRTVNQNTADLTKVSRRRPQADPDTGEPLAMIRNPYMKSFEEFGEGRGGSISVGRYGVDYHIEFYCHPTEDAELAAQNCIDEASAKAFVAEMEGKN